MIYRYNSGGGLFCISLLELTEIHPFKISSRNCGFFTESNCYYCPHWERHNNFPHQTDYEFIDAVHDTKNNSLVHGEQYSGSNNC